MEARVTPRTARPRAYRPPESTQTCLTMQALGPLSELEALYAPAALHLAGDQGLLGRDLRRVAIVGSRQASEAGLRRAAKLANALAREGVIVVSGLARGIDKAAHAACIATGGRTIAVLGTPLDKAYPSEHAALQESIAQEHLLVSQFPSGHRTYKSDFVKRNRTMALLCHASVIVEAGDTSGTLSQAAETQRLGRPLFMMKSVFSTPGITWPARFASNGAVALEEVSQILDAVRGICPGSRRGKRASR